ncbi:hypothetical protein [Kaistia adipata]|uniref:hypothetical protein n=1 Tax=Kaistia adipata TaxID=166954 RepID=UPI0004106DEC|nr:hypothetical protein [Kaistia adipata]
MNRFALLGALAVLLSLATMPAGARDLFQQPGLFTQPKMFDVPIPRIQTPGAPKVPGPTANQCRVMAGTCPLGRLERVGTTCFCRSAKGGLRQGTTETRPQGPIRTGPP